MFTNLGKIYISRIKRAISKIPSFLKLFRVTKNKKKYVLAELPLYKKNPFMYE